jgi:hypothetical protein
VSLPIRLGRPSDMAFVIDSWTKSYEGGPPYRGCSFEHYRTDMTKAIRRICDKAELRVAYDPKDDDHLVGYACFTGRELHYLYVKKDFRAEVTPEHLLRDAQIDSFTFGGRHIQDALDGFRGAHYETDPEGKRHWKPPSGWRFTPRITL